MKKEQLKYLLIFTFTAMSYFQLTAQTLSAQFDTDTILIGDIFSLELEVSNALQGKVFFPTFTDTIGKFEILESHPEDTSENSINKKWDLSVYEPGEYAVNGFSALMQRKDGQIDTLENDVPLIIFVKTLEVDTSKAIKPIKAPKELAFPYKAYAKKYMPYLLFVFIAILLVFLWYRYKNKDKNKVIIRKTALDFYSEALNKLKELEHQKLWQNNEVKEYYLGISEILRNYIEGRFKCNAMESTTDEIIEDLTKVELSQAFIQKLKNILQQCDLAKFAKFKPIPEENIRLMKLAQDFVSHTKPRPVIEEQKKTTNELE